MKTYCILLIELFDILPYLIFFHSCTDLITSIKLVPAFIFMVFMFTADKLHDQCILEADMFH
jgi:hypothetical protein